MARMHQLNVLAALDRAKTQRYHLSVAVFAGTGLLAGAYTLFSTAFVTMLIGRVYYADAASPGEAGNLPLDASSALYGGAAFGGMFVGQLAFGWLGDRIGRQRAYGFTLALMGVCSAASGLSFGRTAKAVVATFGFFRFWLGVGFGGAYPLSAAIAAECASKRTRGAFVASIHAMQGVGALLASAVVIALSYAVPEADYMWRAMCMVGALPAALGFYLCKRLPETARYTALAARDPKRAAADVSRVLRASIQEQELDVVSAGGVDHGWGLFSLQFLKTHGLHLLVTSSALFLLDLSYYSQNILQRDLLAVKFGWDSRPPLTTMDAVQEASRLARALALFVLSGPIPGQILSVALIDVLGRRRLQLVGFLVMTLSMLALAALYEQWTSHVAGFMALYSLAFLFANAGPNTTTFVTPIELFPTRLRCTCYGIAAAAGRAGVLLGTFGFFPKKGADSEPAAGIGTRNELFVLAGTNFLGMLMVLFVPETRGASLEVLSKEVIYEVVEIATYN